jgi:hypothetical protein
LNSWSSFLGEHREGLPRHLCRRAQNRIDELELAGKARGELLQTMDQESRRQRDDFAPPVDQSPIPSRRPLRNLGEDSPLHRMNASDAIRQFRGFGLATARSIDWSTGDIRRFKSRKAFRKFMGLAPGRRQSCTINKSFGMLEGRPWLRALMIEAAWNWLRHQPQSHLAKKYQARLQGASRRARKIAICALAGELAEALYDYLIHGKEILGAILKKS